MAGAQVVTLVVDGAYSAKYDIGGWAAILIKGERELEIFGYEQGSSNNRMEMMAVIEGLKELKRPATVHIISDSEYVIKGSKEWHIGWIKRKWLNTANEPVKNRALWEELLALLALHNVTWEHTRGHIGHELNERADRLAVLAREIGAEETEAVDVRDRVAEPSS